jgi:putative ABC transport system ATP-binding protein
MENILSVENLTKRFVSGHKELTVLDTITFDLPKGSSLSVVGPSGSGKTTLLGLCAGLDLPTSGNVTLAGIKLNALDEDDRAYMRNKHVGFIFQNFQLLPTLSALENVLIPLELRGERPGKEQARELLDRVGLGDRFSHYPSQLSGGEQQRVAMARAFITQPDILFADEPTGNLDEATAETVTDLLFSLNRESGTTLVLVTHNMELASHTHRILELRGGHLIKDTARIPG